MLGKGILLQSHNCNTVSFEQALAWQRPLLVGSGMFRCMIFRLYLFSLFHICLSERLQEGKSVLYRKN